MGAKLTGDWKKLISSLEHAGKDLGANMSKGISRSLGKIERKVLDHIDRQDLGWDELSEPYAKRKKKAGLDPDTLRATNQMYENITTDRPDAFTGAVGVTRGVKTKDGEDITEIALIHEQPDDDGVKIPARKLWKPVFEEVKDDVGSELMGVTIRTFKK